MKHASASFIRARAKSPSFKHEPCESEWMRNKLWVICQKKNRDLFSINLFYANHYVHFSFHFDVNLIFKYKME